MRYNLPPDEGKKKKQLYWNVCVVLGIISIIAFTVGNVGDEAAGGEYVMGFEDESVYMCADGEQIFDPEETLENNGEEDCRDGSDERENGSPLAEICGGIMCLCSLIYAISALSTKNDTQRVVVVQQQPQYVPVVQQVIQQPRPTTKPNPPATPIKNKSMWAAEARNLELARNWEAAADAYQKAGMYAEAGRIRKEHLEQNQPVVQIGQVGNTVLNDSVMIAESTQKKCVNCGNVAEASWKICPHCSSQL
tara:strand:- start:6043 stop:6792 length:750 start_codon:yes stop_codon:yes gene_type:complete